MQPAKFDLYADRWVPFRTTMTFIGHEFPALERAMHIRATPDAPGVPLEALGAIGIAEETTTGIRLLFSGSDTVENHIAAQRLNDVPAGLSASSELTLSYLAFRLNDNGPDGGLNLPLPAEVGADATFYWDLHIETTAGEFYKFAGGRFIVQAGVTR